LRISFRNYGGFGLILASALVEPLVDEFCRLSPEFKALWQDNDVPIRGRRSAGSQYGRLQSSDAC
jgi:hypothetical protein